jgi:hypothetical protein
VEPLPQKDAMKDIHIILHLTDTSMLKLEVVKVGKSRAAIVGFSETYDETFVMYAHRSDGRAKEISIAEFLVACASGHINEEASALLRNWQLTDVFSENVSRFDLADEKPVCEISLDLV